MCDLECNNTSKHLDRSIYKERFKNQNGKVETGVH